MKVRLPALLLCLAFNAFALTPREEARRLLADDFAALNRGEKTLVEIGERARSLAETAETPELSEVLLSGAVRLFERAEKESNASGFRRLWSRLVAKRDRTSSSTGLGLYCVIDLSSGSDAEKYPVSYLKEMPQGGWTAEYKTKKLVLRRVEPGPAVLVGQGPDQRRTSVSSSYYLGVFEVTQGQWEQVMGTRPSFWRGRDYALRPVECVSYEKIRGKGGAASGPSAIGGSSFLGLLRRRTGIAFDLPTDCQWEYACAAGVAADYNNGGACTNGKANAAMDAVGRYRFNGGWNDAEWGRFKWTTYDKVADRECDVANGTAAVGSYLPNTWGFYDMHGNVWEWCRDTAEGHEGARVLRGGWWLDDAKECCTCVRKYGKPDSATVMNGFRLCLPLAERIGEDAHVAEARKRLAVCFRQKMFRR